MRTRIFPLMLCLLTLALCAPTAEAGPLRATAKGVRKAGRVVTAPVRFLLKRAHRVRDVAGCSGGGCSR